MTMTHGPSGPSTPENPAHNPDVNQESFVEGEDFSSLIENEEGSVQVAPDLRIVQEHERAPAPDPKNSLGKKLGAAAVAVALTAGGAFALLRGGGEGGQTEGVETAPIGADAPEDSLQEELNVQETLDEAPVTTLGEIPHTEAPETIRYEMSEMTTMSEEQIFARLNNREMIALGVHLYDTYGGENPETIYLAPNSNLDFYLGTANRLINVATENKDARVLLPLFANPAESNAYGSISNDFENGGEEMIDGLATMLGQADRIEYSETADGSLEGRIIVFESEDMTQSFTLTYQQGLLQLTDV